MKINSYFAALSTGLMLACLGLNGCKEPEKEPAPVPSIEATFTSSDSKSATFTVKTSKISEIAFAAYSGTPEAEQTEDVLFMSGTKLECTDGENTVTVTGLDPVTDYTLYIAATTVEEKYYGEVITVNFSTSDYEEDVTLISTDYDGFSMHVKMPESVKENGNVLRFSYSNILMYNSNKAGWMASSDASMLEANGGLYMVNDTTITFNDDNQIYIDEYGDCTDGEKAGIQPCLMKQPTRMLCGTVQEM